MVESEVLVEWVTTKQIQALAKCGRSKAQQIKQEANQRIVQNGGYLVDRKKAPKHIVLKMLGLEI